MDRSKIKIALNGEFDAAEMEEILRDLATARASIEPAVPIQPPADGEILEQERALFRIRTLAGGGIRIWLRNEGFGWLAFTLDARDKDGLREFLSKQAGHTYTPH